MQHPCQFPRPLLSTTAVAPQQGDDTPSLRIQHENGWIPLLALDQRGDQPGHSTNRANEQQRLFNPPVANEQLLDLSIRSMGFLDLTASLQAIQQGFAGGGKADADAAIKGLWGGKSQGGRWQNVA